MANDHSKLKVTLDTECMLHVHYKLLAAASMLASTAKCVQPTCTSVNDIKDKRQMDSETS